VITSIIVVLPAPLGPMMQRSSPALMFRLSAFSALKPSKLTVMSSRNRMAPCFMTATPVEGCEQTHSLLQADEQNLLH
jgi:hypothetical protein